MQALCTLDGLNALTPDLVRAAVSHGNLRLRNPGAIRPWQHVLSPLSGYLVLAQALCGGEDRVGGAAGDGAGTQFARAWNFGPSSVDARTVEWIVQRVSALWPGGVPWSVDEGPHPHEAGLLSLDSCSARRELGWVPLAGLEEGLAATVAWYLAWQAGEDPRELSLGQVYELG